MIKFTDFTNIEDKQLRYDKLFLSSATLSAGMSYCKRLQVGAVLVKENRILANAWNGTIAGMENCCELPDGSTSEFVLHAEQNIIAFSSKRGISTDGCTLYITHSPCKQCSKLIAQSGIKRVVYNEKYRDDGLDFLQKIGVKVENCNL